MAAARHTRSAGVTRFNRDIAIAQSANRNGGALIAQRGIAQNEFLQYHEDFLGKAGQTPVIPWVATKVGTSATNVVDFVTGASGNAPGEYKLLHSSTAEAQSMRLDFNDSLLVNASKQPRMEVRLKLDTNAATFSADQRLVVGFASAYNATLDNVTHNAWFRIEGASLAIKVEGDDNTTDTNLQATGVSYVDNTYLVLEVEIDANLVAWFTVDGTNVGSVSLAALPANTALQPLIAIQKDAGTETEQVTIDYVDLTWTR